ncbi:MAG: hypothetical protein JNN11_01070 [Candidatus Doudnabacteria bacterium]|nr:hypothetical protein [Candidatus Doudnabacteria bacterium]
MEDRTFFSSQIKGLEALVLELPASEWMRVDEEDGKRLKAAGRPVVVEYLEGWKTPNDGAKGINRGLAFFFGEIALADKGWCRWASALAKENFGSRGGSYIFYVPANEPGVLAYYAKLKKLDADEAARWAEKKAQGLVRVVFSIGLSGGRAIEVKMDGETLPEVWGEFERFGFPARDWNRVRYSEVVEMPRTTLGEWYGKALEGGCNFERHQIFQLAEVFPDTVGVCLLGHLRPVTEAAVKAAKGRGSMSELRKALRDAGMWPNGSEESKEE